MSYRIASFNMYNFSLRSDLVIKKNLDTIARIIKDNNIDLVAMQEVLAAGRPVMGIQSNKNAQNKLPYEKSLLYRLGKDWESYWGNPETRSKYYPYLGNDSRSEGYAFLWNSKKFELLKDENGDPIWPKIYRNYHVPSGQLRLIRDPLYGRFKIRGTKTELRLITTHIIYGKPKDENIKTEYTVDDGAISLRRNEFNILAGNIYSRISDYRKDINNTDPYTIILGDYNLNLQSSDVKSATIPDVAYFNAKGQLDSGGALSVRKIYTCQSQKSSLGEKAYANNYDHFSFDDNVLRLLKHRKEIYGIHFDEHVLKIVDGVHDYAISEDELEEEKFARFKKEVSDHVPIILEIDLKKRY
ncbi:MAG: hypothetical protein PUE18_04875 [Firmicutes bacterium]|nr:hypothetical protein [Bacillota bacterium]